MEGSPRGFENARKKAEEFIKSNERLSQLVQEALEKARRKRQALQGFWEELLQLIELVSAYARGEYRNIPWKTIVYAIAAIIYFVNPFDIIPDFIFGIGFLDDAAVIAFVINAIREEMERFREFRSSKSPPKSRPV
jgi:uncharacterized membrane protein YkvA (DUF1232 family)